MTSPFKKFICFGDSITCDWDEKSYVNCWQELANQEYGPDQVEIIAAGVNGETAQDAYYRVHRDVIAHQPDLVTIMFGHNDADPIRSVSDIMFINYIRKTLSAIKHYLPDTTIWLLTPNGLGDPSHEAQYKPYLDQLQQAAVDKNIHLVSMWDVFKDHDLSTIFTKAIKSTYIRGTGTDWLHPNQLGHQIMAEQLMDELKNYSKS